MTSLKEAQELLKICKENHINCNSIELNDWIHELYWYIKNKILEITSYFTDMMDNCCEIWIYSDFFRKSY